MPTPSGWATLVAAAAAIASGRIFGVVELYVIGAGAAFSVLFAVAIVAARRPRLDANRWIHPPILTVGDRGRVDLSITNRGRVRPPRLVLTEPIGDDAAVRVQVAGLRAGVSTATAYSLPAERRGVLTIGPLTATRRDVLGLASASTRLAPEVDVMIAPRVIDLAMPHLGQGALGRHLLAQSRRLGLGEFHGLRDYVDGDEPRTIHWRASARSEELQVREYSAEGVRRCIVVLDRDASSSPPHDPDAFERAVVAAASLVTAGDHAGLTTRFVTAGDHGDAVDLRGPEVAGLTLRVLAPITPGAALAAVDRDPGDGLGLVIVITSGPDAPTWHRTEQLLDPGLTRIGVFTVDGEHRAARLRVDATSLGSFAAGWNALCGHGSLDVHANVARHLDTADEFRATEPPAGRPTGAVVSS